jgi:hypothetical protein
MKGLRLQKPENRVSPPRLMVSLSNHEAVMACGGIALR